MASARVVALALLAVASLVAAARAQAPWPGKPPAEGTWPSDAPPAPSSPPLDAVQQQCVAEYTALRSRVEKMGMAAKAGSEARVSREELCKLLAAHAAVQIKWVKYAEMNMTKCGIVDHIVRQLKSAQATTAETQKKLCGTSLEPNGPRYRWDPPVRPNDYKFLPRISGRSMP